MGKDHRVIKSEGELLRIELQRLRRDFILLKARLRSPTIPIYDPEFPLDAVDGQMALQDGVLYYYWDGSWLAAAPAHTFVDVHEYSAGAAGTGLDGNDVWVKPANAALVLIEILGGGGAGGGGFVGGAGAYHGGVGGGSGAFQQAIFDADALPASLTVVTGHGGVGTAAAAPGGNGAETSVKNAVGKYLAAAGGIGGGIIPGSGGGPGTATGGGKVQAANGTQGGNANTGVAGSIGTAVPLLQTGASAGGGGGGGVAGTGGAAFAGGNGGAIQSADGLTLAPGALGGVPVAGVGPAGADAAARPTFGAVGGGGGGGTSTAGQAGGRGGDGYRGSGGGGGGACQLGSIRGGHGGPGIVRITTHILV